LRRPIDTTLFIKNSAPTQHDTNQSLITCRNAALYKELF
jgi:hypothetical protein